MSLRTSGMKKLPFQLGDIVLHKVDDRKMVVIGYTYPKTDAFGAGLSQASYRFNQPVTKKKSKPVTPEPTGITCRLRNMHGELYSQNYIFEEVRAQAVGKISKPPAKKGA